MRFDTELLRNPNAQGRRPRRFDLHLRHHRQAKGAMLSHGNLLHNVEQLPRSACTTIAEDRFAVLLPMFHSYMLTVGILLPLLVGGSIVIIKSLHPPRNVIQEIFTKTPHDPAGVSAILSQPGQRRIARETSHCAFASAAPRRCRNKSCTTSKCAFRIPLIEGYGLERSEPGRLQKSARWHAQTGLHRHADS